MDSSKVTMNLMIAEFNRAVPGIGNEVRFYVGTAEVEAALLVPGQPYSVYPKKIKRPSDVKAPIAGPIQPPRLEGQLVNIQLAVADTARNPLCQPGHSLVPEEIGLLQLFKTCVLTKYRIPGIQVMWGDHIREGSIIETGKVTTLDEADFVEIIVDQAPLPQSNQVEVDYMVGTESYKITVRRGTTVEQLRDRLNLVHKGRGITAIMSEGCQIANEDSVEEWLQRSKGIPLEAVVPKKVQVVFDFKTTQKHFTIHETATEEEFKALVKPFLSLNPRVQISVIPLGLDDWEIRAGFTYWVAESRQMSITVYDTAHKKTTLKLPGNATLNDACELYRTKWHLPTWDTITITRPDNALLGGRQSRARSHGPV
jgi:hypothetical protein